MGGVTSQKGAGQSAPANQGSAAASALPWKTMPAASCPASCPPPPVSVLVLTQPGRLFDSLLQLLSSLTGVHVVQPAAGASDLAAAQALLKCAAPHVLMLDWECWSPEVEQLLRQARAQSPQLVCVGVVGGLSQQAAARQAGVETVLLRGFSLQELAAVVQRCRPAAGLPEAGVSRTEA